MNGPGPVLLYFETTYYSVDELAGAFRVSRLTLYRLIWSGELESLRIGKQFRVPYRAVRTALGNPDEPYLTIPETAALLRVHKFTVYRMVERKELDVVRFPRVWRIPERAVRAFISPAPASPRSASGIRGT